MSSCPFPKPTNKSGLRKNQLRKRTRKARALGQSGQIVVEYLLLLVVAVGLATLITKTMINRDESNPGIVLSAWRDLLTAIGSDKADDIQR